MPHLPLWAALVVCSLPIVLACLKWIPKRAAGSRGAGVSAELQAALGGALGSWLVITRQQRAQLARFEQSTREMLTQEHALLLPSGSRRARSDMLDVNFLVEVRAARRAGQQWLVHARSIPMKERARVDIGDDKLAKLFEFPWAFETEKDRPKDRSSEFEQLLEQCIVASHVLAGIDDTLTNLGRDN